MYIKDVELMGSNIFPSITSRLFFSPKISFWKPNICIINMRCTKKYNIHFWMDDHKCIMLSSSNCGCYFSSISLYLKREHLRLMVYDLYVHKSGTIKSLKAVIYNVIFISRSITKALYIMCDLENIKSFGILPNAQ